MIDEPADHEAMALIREIKSREGWQEADLLQRCIEVVLRLVERLDSLSQQNRELRAIVGKLVGKPLPKGDQP